MGQDRSQLWRAPYLADRKLSAALEIPGSKSMMARALILAAQADSPTYLYFPLLSRDSELMRGGLVALGIEVAEGRDQQGPFWKITPKKLRGSTEIDVGNAGTVMRFLPSLAALADGEVRFDGDPRSHQRPIKPLIQALEKLGLAINHGGSYCLPMTIHGVGELPGGEVEIDASTSSQYISSLLLIATTLTSDLTITHTGPSIPSLPHIEMTIQALKIRGVEVEFSSTLKSWKIKHGQKISGGKFLIEPDLSNAGVFLAAALLVGGEIRVKNWPVVTNQPGAEFQSIFTQMGAHFYRSGDDLVIECTKDLSRIKGIDIDLSDLGELTPTIAAVAAFASTSSHLRGIGHLRLHETDRLQALATELRKLGAVVVENSDSLEITPVDQGKLLALSKEGAPEIVINTYDDHRIATFGALAGLLIPNLWVENIATTRKTITDFPALWRELTEESSPI
jgi:3-phosphoshikimate 1-carboxyvinyltransferase